MRKIILTTYLIAALSALTTAAHADEVVWSQDFEAESLGQYGSTEPYGTVPSFNIVTPGAGGTGQAAEITFNATNGVSINFQAQTYQYPASGNTATALANYTLEMDMAIQGVNPGFNMEISVEGPDGTTFGGHVSRWTVAAANLPTAGAGYVHITLPLSNSVPGNANMPIDPTSSEFRIAFGALAFPGRIDAVPETIDIDNLQITMSDIVVTNPPPVLNIVKAKPGLRIFEQNGGSVFTQEGIGTVDTNQAWVGSTPANPTTYKIAISSFPSEPNTALHMQFVQASVINPFVAYGNPNTMDWTIRRDVSGFFSQTVAWKTNLPGNGTLTNGVPVNDATNTSTTGVGTWTLTFTNDTDGTLTVPDGSTNAFSLPTDMVALFTNPVVIAIGTTPGSPAGFGQFFDLNRITITNSAGVDDDDFTKDDTLNTNLWNPAFSLDAGSVFQVSTNTPLWINWTTPDDGFGLATKASLTAANDWLSPDYYGGGNATNSTPTKMGLTNKWTLIPSACLPTTDGTVGGPVSPTGFFRLQNPPPSQ